MRSIGRQSCAVSGTLYFFFALLIQRFPSANASLPYFAVISAFLFLNHFPFLLKSIKIAVMNISLIFTNRNAITAITFFCYSVSVKLFLLSIYFSITAIYCCILSDSLLSPTDSFTNGHKCNLQSPYPGHLSHFLLHQISENGSVPVLLSDLAQTEEYTFPVISQLLSDYPVCQGTPSL